MKNNKSEQLPVQLLCDRHEAEQFEHDVAYTAVVFCRVQRRYQTSRFRSVIISSAEIFQPGATFGTRSNVTVREL